LWGIQSRACRAIFSRLRGRHEKKVKGATYFRRRPHTAAQYLAPDRVTRSTADRLLLAESTREQPVGDRGWKASLTTDEDEPAEAVVYCPECAARGFGDTSAVGRT
jgi:hypothetical protein